MTDENTTKLPAVEATSTEDTTPPPQAEASPSVRPAIPLRAVPSETAPDSPAVAPPLDMQAVAKTVEETLKQLAEKLREDHGVLFGVIVIATPQVPKSPAAMNSANMGYEAVSQTLKNAMIGVDRLVAAQRNKKQ